MCTCTLLSFFLAPVLAQEQEGEVQVVSSPDGSNITTETLITVPAALTDLSPQQQGLTQQTTLFKSDKQSVSVIALYNPFSAQSYDLPLDDSLLANEELTGLNYQYRSNYGVTQVQVLTDANAYSSGQLFDVSYGYPMAFAEERGLVKVNIGADYLTLNGNPHENATSSRDVAEHEISPYFSVDGFWRLNKAWNWRYNLKYQFTEQQSLNQSELESETSIVIYTGIDFNF